MNLYICFYLFTLTNFHTKLLKNLSTHAQISNIYIYIYISTRMQDSYTKSIRLFLFINIYKNMQMYSK